MDDVCEASHTHTHCERPFLVARQSQALAWLRHKKGVKIKIFGPFFLGFSPEIDPKMTPE